MLFTGEVVSIAADDDLFLGDGVAFSVHAWINNTTSTAATEGNKSPLDLCSEFSTNGLRGKALLMATHYLEADVVHLTLQR